MIWALSLPPLKIHKMRKGHRERFESSVYGSKYKESGCSEIEQKKTEALHRSNNDMWNNDTIFVSISLIKHAFDDEFSCEKC